MGDAVEQHPARVAVERLSDDLLAALGSVATPRPDDVSVYGMGYLSPQEARLIVAEIQEYRSPLVRARLEYGDAMMALLLLRTSGMVPSRQLTAESRAGWKRIDAAESALRAALATGGTDGK